MDVICVFDANLRPFCTDFHVRFQSRYVDEATVAILGLNDVPALGEVHPAFPVVDGQRISDSTMKAHLSGQPTQRNDHVQISVNGKNLPDVKAFIGEEHYLYFYDVETTQHSRTPSSNILSMFDLKMGKNNVTCIHFGSNLFKEFNIWRLERTDSLIVMDIDGTITKSDITGYIQTVYMGLFSHIHDGIVPFLNTLKDRYHYTIVYLTARPLIHQKETRMLLEGIKDSNGHTMPDGPLFPSKDKLLAALYREVISKTTVKMKSAVLVEINRVFRRAGCPRITPFVLGVGNKEGDAFAYNLAGLNAEHILLIDKNSMIEVWKHKQLQAMKHTNVSNDNTLQSQSTHSGSAVNSNVKSSRAGVPLVKAVSLSGGERFAVKDGVKGDVIATVTTSGDYLSSTKQSSQLDHSKSNDASDAAATATAMSEDEELYVRDNNHSAHSSVNLTGNISITNHDYFGINNLSNKSGLDISVGIADESGENSANLVTRDESASASFPPAERGGIWGFMKRSVTISNVDGLQTSQYANKHVYHSYSDDRLMEYVHRLSGAKV